MYVVLFNKLLDAVRPNHKTLKVKSKVKKYRSRLT